MKRENNELNNGITLIALIITIIVMLILAGVTLNSLFNNESTLNKASESKIMNEKGEIADSLGLAVTTIELAHYTDAFLPTKLDYYKEKEDFVNYGKFDEATYQITSYEYNEEGTVTLNIIKNGGTGTEFIFVLDITNSNIACISHSPSGSLGKNNYNITYELNGGSFADESTVDYQYSANKLTSFSIPTKEGYAFEGWYLSSNFSGDKVFNSSSISQGDVVIYAKWIQETNVGYFEYNTTKNSITGFSSEGINAFKNGNIKEIIFPKMNDGVSLTSIGNDAFSASNGISSNNIVIEKIVIPDTVTTLNNNSFASCSSLTDLTVPISLNTVKTSASGASFNGCTGITKVKFTKGNGNGEGFNYSLNTNRFTIFIYSLESFTG